MHTLIVDDNPVNRAFLLGIMEDQGVCEEAVTGEEALAAFASALERAKSFDVVFLDIQLPGMDGLQALEKMRALEAGQGIPPHRAAKVIITTALDDEHTAARAFFQGQAMSYLTKPMTVGKIFNELIRFGLIEAPED